MIFSLRPLGPCRGFCEHWHKIVVWLPTGNRSATDRQPAGCRSVADRLPATDRQPIGNRSATDRQPIGNRPATSKLCPTTCWLPVGCRPVAHNRPATDRQPTGNRLAICLQQSVPTCTKPSVRRFARLFTRCRQLQLQLLFRSTRRPLAHDATGNFPLARRLHSRSSNQLPTTAGSSRRHQSLLWPANGPN